MGQEGLIVTIIFCFIALGAMTGIFIFLIEYRRRKILYNSEIIAIENQHKLDLLNTQVEVQKDTMTEIGKELHDNLGQKVTLASIYLQQIPIKNDPSTLLDDTNQVNHLLNEILAEMRRLSKSLTSDHIDHSPLDVLIQKEADRISHYTKVQVNVSIKCDTTNFSNAHKIGLFRIFQEFAQNSLKHSNCKNIWVTLNFEDNKIYFVCKDDGVGFDKNQQIKGIGLTNMNRRAIELGGALTILSKKNEGTQIILSIDII
ncbi:MAG TPA: ATP-binding protein [Saprospiraceae bacterium]|nr:ATP-binding protein [Saprospiraceae bacterium]